MSFDVAVGFGKDVLDAVARAVYEQLHPAREVFVGSYTASIEGQSITVAWDVLEAPTFALVPLPSDARARMQAHLQRHRVRLEQVDRYCLGSMDALIDAALATLEDRTVQLRMAAVDLSIDASTPLRVPVTLIVQILGGSEGIRLRPITADIEADAPWDRLVLDVVARKMIELGGVLLSGLIIPPPSIQGLAITPPTVAVVADRIVAVANLASKPQPPIPDASWPAGSFFVLLGPDARSELGQAAAESVGRPRFHDKSKVGTSLGGASYEADAQIREVSIRPSEDDPLAFGLSGRLVGSAEAEVEYLCIPASVSYELSAKDPLSATIAVKAEELKSGRIVLTASVRSVRAIDLELEPTGNFVEKVVGAITKPVLAAIRAVFLPDIEDVIERTMFVLGAIDPIRLTVETVALTVVPDRLSLRAHDRFILATASVTVTSGS